MKKRYISLIITIILFLIFAASTVWFFPSTDILTDEYYLGAHRGNSVDHVENTIPAFESALYYDKYHFIEFDIQYTKDKQIVVHHDLSLTRLQKNTHKIEDLTYEELLEVSDYHIPTYEEVMNLTAGKKPLNIEIKSQGNLDDDLEIVDYVIADLERRGIVNTTLLSSISFELIKEINNRYNNRSSYYQYSDYWGVKRYIDTGLIFYVDESTFTRRIPIIDDISEAFRDSGLFYRSMISSWWLSGANHLMIHGANVRHYNTLRPEIPFNSRVALWTFDDEMYLILPDKEIWANTMESEGFELDEVKPWWED